VEPRLFNKLKPKFYELLVDQKAKSVEFELIKATITHFRRKEDQQLTDIAKEKLKAFLSSKDLNLKYLGLVTLKDILENEKELIV